LANGLVLPHFFVEYSGMPAALAISMAVFVVSAWLARLIAVGAAASSQPAASLR
jgi:hypothetical protein